MWGPGTSFLSSDLNQQNVKNTCRNLHYPLTKCHFDNKYETLERQPTKWSNTLKQYKPMNCLRVFDHFVELAREGSKGNNKKNNFNMQ